MELKGRGQLPSSKDYGSEFSALGVDAVRKQLLLRRWPTEKLAAARVWVESRDNQSWLAGRGDAAPVDRKKNFRRWAIYIATAFGLAYVGARVLRSLF